MPFHIPEIPFPYASLLLVLPLDHLIFTLQCDVLDGFENFLRFLPRSRDN
jgi:hypothetical protein